MKVYGACFHGVPQPEYTRKTREAVIDAVLDNGNFTAHHKWEKAEREGWAVQPMALVVLGKRASPDISKPTESEVTVPLQAPEWEVPERS